jgi:MFS transporter, DHA1 family, quinolone resistance protein
MSLMLLSKGSTVDTLGLVVAIYSVFIVIFEFPSGILSDIIGQKKIYLFSLALSILGYSIVLLTNSLVWLFIGFSFYGVARAFSSGSVEALFINTYIKKNGKEELHKLISVLNSGETIGLATGALLGGVIPILWGKYFPGQNKYNGNLVVQLCILLSLFVFTILGVKEPIGASKEKHSLLEHIQESLKAVIKDKNLLLLIIGTMTWGFCFNAIEVYWQPWVKSILKTDSKTWIFGVINSGYFLASLLGVGVINLVLRKKKVSQSLLMITSRITIGLFIIVLSFQNTIVSFSSIYLLMFMINGMMGIPESTIMNVLIPDDKRSSLLSLSSLVMQLGGIIGSVLFSRIVNAIQISGVWLISGIVFGLSSMLYIKMRVEKT